MCQMNVLLRSSFDFLKNTNECLDSLTEDVNILSSTESTEDYHDCKKPKFLKKKLKKQSYS